VDEPLAAALAVAADHGLPVRNPRVLRDLTNVLVHLSPAPLVARVPVTLARLRPASWFAAEVELARFLAAQGAPVAPLATEVDPGPHEHGGRLVTFWRHVDHDLDRFDPAQAGHALRQLHEALGDWPGPLPTCDRLAELDTLLERLTPSALVSQDELDGLYERHASLAAGGPVDGRPLHGDSHFRNILWSPGGPLWTDLENACTGPVEYDLACIAWRGDPGTRAALAAYGPSDEAELARLEPYLALFLACWTLVVVERTTHPDMHAEARRRVARALAG